MGTQESMQEQGFFWHVDDWTLLRWCFSYKEQANFIRTEKSKEESKEEIKTRLRLFQPVKGNLPQEVVKAGRTFNKAWRARDKAWRALDKALKKNMPAIMALHAFECPDCPWNGRTIFPNR